jgi:hypothetical protein
MFCPSRRIRNHVGPRRFSLRANRLLLNQRVVKDIWVNPDAVFDADPRVIGGLVPPLAYAGRAGVDTGHNTRFDKEAPGPSPRTCRRSCKAFERLSGCGISASARKGPTCIGSSVSFSAASGFRVDRFGSGSDHRNTLIYAGKSPK